MTGASAPEPKWWLAEDITLYNGVFQGGGAKGIAYVGALKAFQRQRSWFGAVAGSSAGAITATLIAAGLRPSELLSATPDGLKEIKRPQLFSQPLPWVQMWFGHLLGVFGASEAVYPTSRLRTWIEGQLRAQYGRFAGRSWEDARPAESQHEDVTFEALAEATGIELFIVSLDISSGVPVVLSPYSAPDCQVSWAAVASSSIPLMMSKQRLLLASGRSWSTADLVDGGAWANYPRFVFDDDSFAAYHGMVKEVRDRSTVGFVLKVMPARRVLDVPSPVQLGRFGRFEAAHGILPGEELDRQEDSSPPSASDEGRQEMGRPRQTSRGVRGWVSIVLFTVGAALLISALENGWWVLVAGAAVLAPGIIMNRGRVLRGWLGVARFAVETTLFRIIGIVLAALILASAVVTAPARAPELTSSGPLGALIVFTVAYTAVFLLAAALVAFLVVLFFHGFIVKDAPRILNASLGAATRVPAWVGFDPKAEFVLRVPVNPSIKTTDFTIDDATLRTITRTAYKSVRRQLLARASDVVEMERPPRVAQWPTPNDLIRARGGEPNHWLGATESFRELTGAWALLWCVAAGICWLAYFAGSTGISWPLWSSIVAMGSGLLWLVLRKLERGLRAREGE